MGDASRLTVFTWEDYFDPEALEAFASETGVEVDYQVFGDSDELEARLRSEPGRFDVLVVDDVSLAELIELRLVREIDKGMLSQFRNLSTEFLDLTFDPANRYSIPYLWGTWVVAYRKDLFPDPPRSWRFLWDERLAGHVMMMEESFDPISITLMMLGRSPNSDSPADYAAATEAMVRQIREVGALYGTDMDVKEALLRGDDVWAAMCYNGDAARVAEENPDIDFFIPEEGTPIWIDNFAVARDTGNHELAMRFIDFMQRPRMAALNANYAWFASPNDAAAPYIDEELYNDGRVWPPKKIRERCAVLAKPGAARMRLINETWHATRLAQREREAAAGGEVGRAAGESPVRP